MPAEPVCATALQFAVYGGPDVLQLADHTVAAPAAGQLRVRVRAAALNPFDAKLRSGAMASEDAPPEPKVVGLDLAGVVEAVGPGVEGTAVGDEVLGTAVGGAMATVALAGRFAAKPAAMAWTDAAAWPTVAEAACRGLRHLGAQAGETVLIHGGAGSVGILAVQLAVRAGARVVATAAERDHTTLAELGAIPVAYGDGWADRVRAAAPGGGIDAVLDTAGAGVLADSVALAGGPDRVVTLADGDAAAHGVRFTGGDPADRVPEATAAIGTWWADGVRLPVGRVYPWSDAVQAYADLDGGRVHGKLVVSF